MTAKVINPSPPISINKAITSWPKGVQCVAVSTRVSPVTHVALVEVNSAVINPVWLPGRVAKGNSNKTVPTAITARKPKVSSLGKEYRW